MKRIATFSVLMLVLSACGGSGDTTTSTTVLDTTTTTDGSGTTTAPTDTTATTDTTVAESTTTTAPTTAAPTTTIPVTVHPRLPSAASGSLTPWGDVGAGWHVAIYDALDTTTWSPAPVVLYLVSPDGVRYEVANWTTDDRPWEIEDARPNGSAVILVSTDPSTHDTVWTLLDTKTRSERVLISAGFPEQNHIRVEFTRPTGLNVVIYRNDGTNEWLERRNTAGTLLATVYTQTVSGRDSLAWLYSEDGTKLLVQHHGGIAYIENNGTLIRETWVPPDRSCEPLKWWDSGTFLASCTGGPAVAPHDYYHQLWILKTDGTAGAALTSIPAGPVDIVEFGYTNAFKSGSTVLLQWSGDCSAGSPSVLGSGGLGTGIPMPWLSGGGAAITGVNGTQMGVHSWLTCGQEGGSLSMSTISGGFVANLIPLIGDSMGVLSPKHLG